MWLPKTYLVAISFCFMASVQGQGFPWNQGLLPQDIARYPQGSDSYADKKLTGPCRIFEGELVTFAYSWDLPGTLKGDPSKKLRPGYLYGKVFEFVGGDGFRTAELKIPSTGQVIVINRPNAGHAPAGWLVSLHTLKTVVGLSKDIVRNRLIAPLSMEKTADGGEVWSYRHVSTWTSDVAATTTSSGFVAGQIFKVDTVTTIPDAKKETAIHWDFKLIFDKDGRVTSLQQGSVGYYSTTSAQ